MPLITPASLFCLLAAASGGIFAEAYGNLNEFDAAAMLKRVTEERGAPKHLRSDNRPESIAEGLRGFLHESNVETLYIEPGSPW